MLPCRLADILELCISADLGHQIGDPQDVGVGLISGPVRADERERDRESEMEREGERERGREREGERERWRGRERECTVYVEIFSWGIYFAKS